VDNEKSIVLPLEVFVLDDDDDETDTGKTEIKNRNTRH
jgi:hypothetical protein